MGLEKEIEALAASDLRDLIENAVSERKTIDYKEILSVHNDEEKREFLADVSSFANAAGGHLALPKAVQHDATRRMARNPGEGCISLPPLLMFADESEPSRPAG